MINFIRITWMRTALSLMCAALVTATVLTACDDDSHKGDDKTQASAQQYAAQLQSERTLRNAAEQIAREADESRMRWIVGLSAGGVVGCVVFGLLGIHIGARAASRTRREIPHD